MAIGSRLRARLEQLGLSQAEAARSLGLSPRRFGHYCNDQREPEGNLLIRICKRLQTHPNYLYGFDDNPNLSTQQQQLLEQLSKQIEELKTTLRSA